MGEVICCRTRAQEHPFLISTIDFPIYSLEELCFYLENNFYMLDEGLLSRQLCHWIKTQLKEEALATKLLESIRKKNTLYQSALLLLSESGFYTEAEIEALTKLFDNLTGKSMIECRKLKADQYLQAGKYAASVAEYRKLLDPEHRLHMTQEIRGNLYHNMGVAYAASFLFLEAADCFFEAYQENRNPISRESYLFALNFIHDKKAYQDRSSELGLDFDAMRDVFRKFQNRIEQRKPDGLMAQLYPYLTEDAGMTKARQQLILKEWKKQFLKSF